LNSILPANVTFGERVSPMMVSALTDLPLPDSPTMATTSPGSSENETPSTACTTPSSVVNETARPVTSSIAIS